MRLNTEKILGFGRKIIPKSIFTFFQPAYHYLLALAGALLYRFPSFGLKVVGVTGTKGKSTIVYLLSKLLEEAGIMTGSLSTIQFKIGGEEKINDKKITMPGRFFIQQFLAKCRRKACKYAILEVSSEGIKQYRHKFIKFDTALFINLEPEHIETHGNFEKYKDAKLKLFKANGLKNIIVNLDDGNAKYFLNANPQLLKIGYGYKNNRQYYNQFNCDIVIAPNEILSFYPVEFKFKGLDFKTNLLGEHNLSNILAVLAVTELINIPLSVFQNAFLKIKGVPGRLEFINTGQSFKAVVDYAHTPNSLEQVYKTLQHLLDNKSSMVCILGAAGGGRDKWKRPIFGKIASKYCQTIILTNEDPYDENSQEIINQIKTGILENNQFSASNIYEIIDRRSAIRKAFQIAKKGDIVVITGKGSEQWMMMANGKKIAWDDRKIATQELKAL